MLFLCLPASSSAPNHVLYGLYSAPLQLLLSPSMHILLSNYPLTLTSYFLVTSPASPSSDFLTFFPTLWWWFMPYFALIRFPCFLTSPPLLSLLHLVSLDTAIPSVLMSHPFFPPSFPFRCAPLSINSCLLSPVWYLLPWGAVLHVSAGVFWETGSWPCLSPRCYTG